MPESVVVLNIREYLSGKGSELGEEVLEELLSEFSCEKNPDVERFLKEQAIAFTKKNQSVTYLLLAAEDASLLGYFTLAVKPITIHAERFSNTVRRKIGRVSELDEETNTYTLSAYLIAQLGRNFSSERSEELHGKEILQFAVDTVKELQYRAGGMVVFLEAEENEKLLRFYEADHFKRFDVREAQSGTEKAHSLVQMLKIL